MPKYLSAESESDVQALAEYIAYYLSETIDDISDWDCEHLAINMLNELKIVAPEFKPFNREKGE